MKEYMFIIQMKFVRSVTTCLLISFFMLLYLQAVLGVFYWMSVVLYLYGLRIDFIMYLGKFWEIGKRKVRYQYCRNFCGRLVVFGSLRTRFQRLPILCFCKRGPWVGSMTCIQ